MELAVVKPESLNFSVTAVGLIANEQTTFENWKEFGAILRQFDTGLQWITGDWLNMGEHRWGEKYKAALTETGYEYQTLRDYAWVCANVELSIRNRQLSFGHHRVIAPLPLEQQVYWLNQANFEGWSEGQLKLHITPKEPPEYPAYTLLKRKLRMFETLRRDDLKPTDLSERDLMLDILADHLEIVQSLKKELEKPL